MQSLQLSLTVYHTGNPADKTHTHRITTTTTTTNYIQNKMGEGKDQVYKCDLFSPFAEDAWDGKLRLSKLTLMQFRVTVRYYCMMIRRTTIKYTNHNKFCQRRKTIATHTADRI